MRKVRFLGLVICCFLLVSNIAFAAPKAGAGNAKKDPTLINMDQYEQTVTYKVFHSMNSSNSYDTLTTLKEQIGPDTFSSTWSWGV